MKPKILCVDDEDGVLQALRRSLKDDFEVLTAPQAALGLQVASAHPDLAVVLSDFRMPELNGIEFLKQIRTVLPLAARAVLSGQMDSKEISDAINRAEIHKFILKPWENAYLRIQMLEALQLHSNLSEKDHFRVQSITDPVTGLFNHRHFQDGLLKSVNDFNTSGNPVSLILIDVDHFKSFNDRYGHLEGDRLLGGLAREILRFVPSPGIAARYGGEEFAVLLPGKTIFEAGRVAEDIRQAVENCALPGPWGHRAYVTVSLGVCAWDASYTQPSDLVQVADTALYQAKRQGRNQTVAAAQ